LPLAKPALVTVAIFTFLNGWNDFLGPLLYINSPERFTVSIGLSTFRSVMRTRWDLLMAATTATTLPVILVFLLAQRYFVKGVVMTGIKAGSVARDRSTRHQYIDASACWSASVPIHQCTLVPTYHSTNQERIMASSVTLVAPTEVRAVGGFLGERFQANRLARLRDCALSEQFIRLHERKSWDDWFWLGEQIGKWLDAATYAGLIARDAELLQRVNDAVARLARSQEADGYLGITTRIHRTPVRGMELYEMYYVLLGLLVCADLLESDLSLETAAWLGWYITRTWGAGPVSGRPLPGNGHDGGEGTLILSRRLLGQRTGDRSFIERGERTLAK
jgi:hypothetical protein